ncbi:hypothetical protein L6R52_42690 [Myxococcota bacterium]|nr:hypothetical protein [Myxococcota bacterium]
MTTIQRSTGSASLLPGADLESSISNVLQEVNTLATQMAQDVVESIKSNNAVLKTLRDLKAAVREKNPELFDQLLNANPAIKSALEKVMGEVPAEKTIEVPVTRIELPTNPMDLFTGRFVRTTTQEQTVPISDEDWDSIAKHLDDLTENFNAFGQEQQLGLQNAVTRVSQSFTAMTNVSARFSGTGDNIIGNLRG